MQAYYLELNFVHSLHNCTDSSLSLACVLQLWDRKHQFIQRLNNFHLDAVLGFQDLGFQNIDVCFRNFMDNFLKQRLHLFCKLILLVGGNTILLRLR